jgi:hypothetical protein
MSLISIIVVVIVFVALFALWKHRVYDEEEEDDTGTGPGEVAKPDTSADYWTHPNDKNIALDCSRFIEGACRTSKESTLAKCRAHCDNVNILCPMFSYNPTDGTCSYLHNAPDGDAHLKEETGSMWYLREWKMPPPDS